MQLSEPERQFLSKWLQEDATGVQGPATALQRQHQVPSHQLGAIIAASIPPQTQLDLITGPEPTGPTEWPWTDQAIQSRLKVALTVLKERRERAGTHNADSQ